MVAIDSLSNVMRSPLYLAMADTSLMVDGQLNLIIENASVTRRCRVVLLLIVGWKVCSSVGNGLFGNLEYSAQMTLLADY